MTEVRGWCDAHGWAVAVTDKSIVESKLGEYLAPALQLRTINGDGVYVEPVARHVAGADGLVHIHQVSKTPDLRVVVDRTKADQLGLTQRDVANDLLVSLSSSAQTSSNYWLDPKLGVQYSVAMSDH